tara:strand:- start:369 stop:1703 length:1335 start_codon:yes stop_codon:yes gene_type:complete
MRLSDLQEEVTNLFKEHPLSDLPTDILEMLLNYYNLNSYGMATQKMKQLTNSITAQLKQNGYTISQSGDVLKVTKGRDQYVAHDDEIMDMILKTLYRDGDEYDIDEGMGGSSGGGTAGSAGAGGSSLGLPYPSTYEEEYDKFKNFHPINKNKRPMHNLSMTTEEQQEMFKDYDVMQLLMKDKEWPQDLQTEVLRKYAGSPQEGENFIDSVEYEGTKKVDNYGLLQNTDNMFILAGLPQTVIKTINETWGIRIKPSKYAKMSDLEFKKWVNTPGYVSQPTVVIDSDVVLAEGKWIASIIRGEKSKLAHVLSPGAPKVKKNEPNQTIAPAKQKELAFVESEEDKLWKRDELPQLSSKDFEDSEYTLKKLKVSIDKLKPVQNERVRGLVKKTIKMLKSGKEKPIVVDKFGYIVNGHHRYDAYTKLGVKTVPVLKVNATIEELIDKYM